MALSYKKKQGSLEKWLISWLGQRKYKVSMEQLVTLQKVRKCSIIIRRRKACQMGHRRQLERTSYDQSRKNLNKKINHDGAGL